MKDDAEMGLVTPIKTRRRADIFLLFCRMLNVATGLCAGLCMTAQAMAFVVGPPMAQNLTATLEQSLRLYGVAFSIFVILVESDWQRFMAHVRLFESWVARGLFQMFLAVLTLSHAVSNGSDDFHLSLQLYRRISGLCLIGCASVYLCGGLLCFGYIKRGRMQRMAEMGQLQSALQTLEKEEKEIRETLSRYSIQ